MPKIYVSKEHLEQLQQELTDDKASLSQLRSERALACEVSACASQNSGQYLDQLAVDEGTLVQRIARIQQIVSSAEIYDLSVRNVERVCLGSIVRIARHYNRREKGKKATETWEIVGSGETNMSNHQVSYDTPFGTTLIGMKIGDIKEASMPPLGAVEFEILDLYPDWDAANKSMAPVKLVAAAAK